MSDQHPTPHPLDGKLEPETKDCFDERAALYSIAISLKRIVDVMTGTETHLGMRDAVAASPTGCRGRTHHERPSRSDHSRAG